MPAYEQPAASPVAVFLYAVRFDGYVFHVEISLIPGA